MAVQNFNKRNNLQFEYKGKVYNTSQASIEFGIPEDVLRDRVSKHGWSVERALTQKPQVLNRKFTFKGKAQTLREWSDEYGVAYDNLKYRLKAGWSMKAALMTPTNMVN